MTIDEPDIALVGDVAYEVDGVPLPQTASSQFAEIIDPESGEVLPIETGVSGELVYTSLERECVPLLRFRTRDRVTVTEIACPCGRTSFAMRCVGRTDDMLIVLGVIALGYQLRQNMPPIAQRTFPKEGFTLYDSDDEVAAVVQQAGFTLTEVHIFGDADRPGGRLALARPTHGQASRCDRRVACFSAAEQPVLSERSGVHQADQRAFSLTFPSHSVDAVYRRSPSRLWAA